MTLSGRAWLAFARQPAGPGGRPDPLDGCWVEGSYRADCRLDAGAISGLHKSVETWIRKHV